MAQVAHDVSVSIDLHPANTVSYSLCPADEDRHGGRGGGKDRDRRQPPPLTNGGYQNGIPTAPRAQREKAAVQPPQSSTSSTMPPPPRLSNSETTTDLPPMSDTDLNAIRSRYLGVDKKKRKIRKMNDRKFVFDWDTQDDTAADMPAPPVVPGQGVAQVMFGRGHIAGMDDYHGARRTDVESQLTDPMERRRAAKNGIDERHWSEKPLLEMKDRDWRIFREDFSIAARGACAYYAPYRVFPYAQPGGSIPHPLRSWEESSIPPQILEIIDQVGYKEPSPIQRQAIPIGLQNRDIIGIAETGEIIFSRFDASRPENFDSGSGKTAAFVIPMLSFISNLPPFTDDNRHLGPYSLIMAPTRELAQQIESETRKFAGPLGFTCVSIVGGVSRNVDNDKLCTEANTASIAFSRGATIQPPRRCRNHHRDPRSVEGCHRKTCDRSFAMSIRRHG